MQRILWPKIVEEGADFRQSALPVLSSAFRYMRLNVEKPPTVLPPRAHRPRRAPEAQRSRGSTAIAPLSSELSTRSKPARLPLEQISRHIPGAKRPVAHPY